VGVRLAAVVVALLALPSTAAARNVESPDGAVYRSGLTGSYFHPLGSFGKLNRAVTAGNKRLARQLARSLVARGRRQGRFGLVWHYNVPGGRSGWTSGLAQAVAAQALARAGRKEEARRAFLAIPDRLLIRLRQGPWIKLYGYSGVAVLNAQLQAALSIGHYARLVDDDRARLLARRLRRTARLLLPRFDTGSWSRYSLGGRPATLEYHSYVTELLWRLSARQRGGRWRIYANRFSKYRRLPPVLRRGDRPREVLPVADGYRDYAPISFWLSKPSTVTFRIAGTRTSQWFGRGWQTFRWWPLDVAPGRYPVWATATDLAGNRTQLGLPWVRVVADRTPPSVRVVLDGRRLEWRSSDSQSPWFDVKVERLVGGRKLERDLGRFDRQGSARLRTQPRRMGTTALLVADSSGNVVRIPLCAGYTATARRRSSVVRATDS
jgi:hypothetical protein